MACSECKKKKSFKDLQNKGDIITKRFMWFIVIWTLFGLYGLYELINKLI